MFPVLPVRLPDDQGPLQIITSRHQPDFHRRTPPDSGQPPFTLEIQASSVQTSSGSTQLTLDGRSISRGSSISTASSHTGHSSTGLVFDTQYGEAARASMEDRVEEGRDNLGMQRSSPSTAPLSSETPKIALHSDILTALSCISIHAISIAVTLTVVQFSLRGHYWMDMQAPEKRIALSLTQGGALNLLQFAAKLHELLTIASLSAMVIHVMRALLVGQKGLPFGLFASSFQLGSGEFWWTKAFWASCLPARSTGNTDSRKWSSLILFIILFVLSSVLAVLIGPSSAISIIPTLDWFPVQNPFNISIPPFFILDSAQELWPDRLTNKSFPKQPPGFACADFRAPGCPSSDYYKILPSIDTLPQSLLSSNDVTLTITDKDFVNISRSLVINSCDGVSDEQRASAFTPNIAVSDAVGLFWKYIHVMDSSEWQTAARPRISTTDRTALFSPHVNVVCTAYVFNSSNLDDQANMTFPLLNKPSGLDVNVLQVPSQTWNFTRNLTERNFTWVDLESSGTSLAALWTIPIVTRDGIYGQETMQLPCVVDARWAPIDASFDPSDSKALKVNVDIARQDSCLNIRNSQASNRRSNQIKIERSWAAALDVRSPAPGNTSITDMQQLIDRFIRVSPHVPNGKVFDLPLLTEMTETLDLDTAKTLTSRILSSILSVIIVNGLASVGGRLPPAFMKKIPTRP